MAKLTKWALFLRVFAVTLLTGPAGRSLAADDVEVSAWQRAVQQDTIAAYYRYLYLYPTGDFIHEAVEALRRLGALPNVPLTRELPAIVSIEPGQRSTDRDSDDQDGVY